MNTKNITQNFLKEILHYDFKTGIFTYIKRTANCISIGDIAGTINNEGYLSVEIKGISHKLHRLAWLYIYGKIPKDQIDHINRIRDDNKISNLRCATNTENQRNRTIGLNNKSGVIGVSFFESNQKWYSEISHNSKKIHLGCFINFNDAVIARKMAEYEYKYMNRD